MPLKKFHSENDIDHGLALPINCFKCDSGAIHLFEYPRPRSQGFFKLFIYRLSFSNASIWGLRCNSCKAELEVPKNELAAIKEINSQTSLLQKGEISTDEYVSKIQESHLPEISSKLNILHNWTCAECESENPLTFETCWNCSTPHPQPENLIPAAPRRSFGCCG